MLAALLVAVVLSFMLAATAARVARVSMVKKPVNTSPASQHPRRLGRMR
jgi:hypothetical protein